MTFHFENKAAVLALVLCWAGPAFGEEAAKDYREWLALSESVCAAEPGERLAAPTTFSHGGFDYVVEGARGSINRKAGAGEETKIGLVAALLDDTAESQANLEEYLARFKKDRVSAVVFTGGTGRIGDDTKKNLVRAAKSGLPVLALIANSESRGEFNLGVREASASNPNILHLGLVRVLKVDGVTLVSIPGYHDESRLYLPGTCKYKKADLKTLPALTEGLAAPVFALLQGSPRFKGRDGLDYLPLGGNIGDPEMAKWLKKAGIRFGVVSTVPEAGPRASDLAGASVESGVLADELFVNPGCANSLPTRMNAGGTSYGTAAIVTFKGTQASFEVLRSKQRVGAIRTVRTK